MKKLIVIFLILAFVLPSCTEKSSGNPQTEMTSKSDVTTNPEDTDSGPTTVTLNVGSYNVAHFGREIDGIKFNYPAFAKDINSKKLDIVGLQEVENMAAPCGYKNQTELLADELGWEYYEFAKAIDYEGGGYGHSIISKYPIKSFNVMDLPGGGEHRVFGHAVIDVNGVEINFINTHLSFENEEWRARQFIFLATYVKKLDNFIIVGDFNTHVFEEYAVIENATLLNNEQRSVLTFPSTGLTKSIDNIVVSPMFTLGRPKTLVNTHSDHVMLYTEVTYMLPQTKD